MRSVVRADLEWLAREADRLAKLELELVDGMAAERAEQQRRQIRLALAYARGDRTVTRIAADHHCSTGLISYSVRKWGVPQRNSQPELRRRGGKL